MPKKRERKCLYCGTREDLNYRGTSCFPCSSKRMHSSVQAMMKKEGPEYEKWLAAMKARFS